MNQGIYYLYEYETGQRKRNLGFLQISHQYRSCMMTLHLKSLPLSPGTALELHGFYNKDGDLIHAPCAILNYSGGSIATRLSISESLFPCGKSFSGLEGFLLLPEGKAEPLFWAASVNALPVGFSLISTEELSRSPEEVSPVESSPSPEEVSVHAAELKPKGSETVETTGSETPITSAEIDESAETAETSSETVTSAPAAESMEPDIDSAESAGTQPVTSAKAVKSVDPGDSSHLATTATVATGNAAPVSDSDDTGNVTARKITRAELSTLPRKFWSLANNSFLLHGYYNYNHLLLVEEDGHIWLGVPGIYDTREARAADLFGFPQFTSSYVSVLELGDDERNNDALFGHWCRYLATK